MADEEDRKKEAERKLAKPGEVAGKWIDTSHWQSSQSGGDGETWVKDGMFVPDPQVDYGKAPAEGWAPIVEPTTGTFSGWTNPANGGVMPYSDKGELQPEVRATINESKGQYGYGSKGKQKRLRFFTYLTKGLLTLMAGYGAGGAAGLWGGAAAGAGEGAVAGAASEGALAGTGAEGALGGLGGVEPISTSGFTAGQGGIGSLGSGWGSSGVVAGEGGGAGTAATSGLPEWTQWARRGMNAMQDMGGAEQQQPVSAAPSTAIEQYSMPDNSALDERAAALRQAALLRSRIAQLKAQIGMQESTGFGQQLT